MVVDDSHATGFVGDMGRGTAEYCGVQDKVDIITGMFGKALGVASGGFTSGRKEIIDLLRQRSRAYLFSNMVALAICETTLKALEMIENDTTLTDKVSYIINTYGHLLLGVQFMLMELFKEMYRRMKLFLTQKGNSCIKANEELKKIVKRLKKKTTVDEFIESRVLPISEKEEKVRIKNFQKIYGKRA